MKLFVITSMIVFSFNSFSASNCKVVTSDENMQAYLHNEGFEVIAENSNEAGDVVVRVEKGNSLISSKLRRSMLCNWGWWQTTEQNFMKVSIVKNDVTIFTELIKGQKYKVRDGICGDDRSGESLRSQYPQLDNKLFKKVKVALQKLNCQ